MAAKRIPIKAVQDMACDHGLDQVIVFGWKREGNFSTVATFGRTEVDCDQAAQAGNWIKRVMLKWPESECCAEPSRVRRLKARIKALEESLANSREE